VSSFLFLLHGYPDIDHITPMIWKCLEKGDRVFAVFAEPYPYRDDYRLRFLMNYPRFRVINLFGVESRHVGMRLLSRILWNSATLRLMLRRYKIAACFMEWGPGIPPATGNARLVVDEIRAFTRSPDATARRRALRQLVDRFLQPLRIALIAASRRMGLPVLALPHGINTKQRVDHNPKIRELLNKNGGKLLRPDRNTYTAWVYSTEFERQLAIHHTDLHPAIAQTWGSLRFSPEWMQIVEKICPKVSLPPRDEEQIRLIFFLPKWHNFVDKQETLHLLHSLAQRQDIQLVLKTHPRKGTSELDEDLLDKLLFRPNVSLNAEGHSPALIMDADVIIDIGSGMSIEAILRRKHLIYPAYLHQNRLIFDDYPGSLIAYSLEEVHRFLNKIIERTQPCWEQADLYPLLRELIYGGQHPYDVPEHYYARIQDYVPPKQNV
jgi:hypothetical protein